MADTKICKVNCSKSEPSNLTNLLYEYFIGRWAIVFIILFFIVFVGLFFGRIYVNNIDYSEYLDKFEIKCKESKGVIYIPKGVKGWPEPQCRNSLFLIHLDT